MHCLGFDGFSIYAEDVAALRNNCAFFEEGSVGCFSGGVDPDIETVELDDVVDVAAFTSFSVLALRSDGTLHFRDSASNAEFFPVRLPCDLTSDPPLLLTRLAGAGVYSALTADGIFVPLRVARCVVPGTCAPEDEFISLWDPFLTEQHFRSDLDPACALSFGCCVDVPNCTNCLRRLNLCGAPSDCDGLL